jgi:hypothetical protein
MAIFDESVLSLYYRALANRSPDWCLLKTLFSWRHTSFHVVISFEDVQNTQTEHHIYSSWCIRMYYEDTVTMKTCFQMLKTCNWHCVICLDEESRVWLYTSLFLWPEVGILGHKSQFDHIFSRNKRVACKKATIEKVNPLKL